MKNWPFSKIHKYTTVMILTALLCIAFASIYYSQSVHSHIKEDLNEQTKNMAAVSDLIYDISEIESHFTRSLVHKQKDISYCLEHLNNIREELNAGRFDSLEKSFSDELRRNETKFRTLLYAYNATYFEDPACDLGKESLEMITSILSQSRESSVEYCHRMQLQINKTINRLLSELQKAQVVMYITLAVALLVVVLVMRWFTSSLRSYLKQISVAAEKIGRGDLSYRINTQHTDQIGGVARAIDSMAQHLEHTEQELRETNKTLLVAIEESRKAEITKNQFLANMSHEIRTPMNAIIGFSDLLAEDELNEEQSQYLTTIRNSAGDLLSIINDILDFSKIEAGKIAIETKEYALVKLIDYVVALMKPLATKKNVDFDVSISNVPEMVETDRLRVCQCLINLINNAIKFTHKGSVHLDVSARDIEEQSCIIFKVTDTGIGIPADKLDTIFDSFSQADGSTTRKYGGTGLGLTITKKLIELLGGTITVTSQQGSGSCFTMTLPVKYEPVSLEHQDNLLDHLLNNK